MDLIAGGVPTMSREQMNLVVLVVGKEKSVPSETAPKKRVLDFVTLALHFPAIHFC